VITIGELVTNRDYRKRLIVAVIAESANELLAYECGSSLHDLH
jgi:hypothetical protein